MAIHYNDLPFEIAFTLRFQTETVEKKVTGFYSSEQELLEHAETSTLEIHENVPLEILFTSGETNAKLFMDGLDTLPEKLLGEERDGGEIFLTPSLNPVVLFQHDNGEFYPFIPGMYRIKVVLTDQTLFSWLRIVPKQINEDQWEIMKNEVEAELRGLAQDLMRKNYGYPGDADFRLPPDTLRQFRVIEHRFSAIMSSITDLYKKINLRIRKEYHLISYQKSNIIDEVTIRHRAQHPESEEMLLTPVKKIHYDLAENRMVKKIVSSLITALNKFIISVEDYKQDLLEQIYNLENGQPVRNSEIQRKKQVLKDLQEYLGKAVKMRGALNWFKTAPWYGEVSLPKDAAVPHSMTADVRYRTLFQVQRELNNQSVHLSIDQDYMFQWKRTDKLYELWGFIQFVKLLQHDELDFVPVSGWIYDMENRIEDMIIPTIPEGTRIIFEKDRLKACLVYDGKIPSRSSETDGEREPLYTNGTNNRPDGRLDIYEDEMYIGSLIFDFKYRPKMSIWKNELVLTNYQTNTMKQLVSYAFNCRSLHLYGNRLNELSKRKLRPVSEVWALYPKKYGSGEIEFYEDHGVRLLELSPGCKSDHLAKELKEVISGILQAKGSFLHEG